MKKRHIILFFAFALSAFKLMADKDEAHFLTNPTLSPDGSKIVFVYENDLWQVETAGGKALRLTGMDGAESNPQFSPDGNWIAFSSTQNGNADVYALPVNGGKVKQLTFHEANDFVESWSWDSQTINFSSNRYNTVTSYKVNITGNTPKRLFGDSYHNNPHHLAEVPGENAFYFTESWESFVFPTRKRYKGAHNPDIKYYNSETKEYKELTDYDGKDLWPTVDKDGKLYFASDEANEVYNLYTFTNGEKKQLTQFTTAIGRPKVSANGEKVVFIKDYQLFVYDVASKNTSKPEIDIVKNEVLKTNISYNTNGKITNFAVSDDHKKIAFISRGCLFVSDIKGKFVKKVNTNPLERVIEIQWLPDNKTLIYLRTTKGWVNIFTTSAQKEEKEKQITFDNNRARSLTLSPKKDKAVYINGSTQIKSIDLKSFETEKIIEDEFWFRGSDPVFSPDGKYIAYIAYRNFEPDIFIYNFEKEKTINITNTGVPEIYPFWSPDGKYIYFSANRYFPGFPRGGAKGDNKIYRIPLYRFSGKFKSDKYESLFTEKEEKDTIIDIKIDLEGIAERWEMISYNNGAQFYPFVIKDNDKQVVLFNLYSDQENTGVYKTVFKPFEQNKTEKVFEKAVDFITTAKNKYFALAGGNIYEIKNSGSKLDKIDINYSFSKNLHNEFVQMFYENWALLAGNFYDIQYHGVDWNTIKNQYEQFVPYIRNRENLRTLQVDMLGELNASHLNFTSTGKEQETFYTQTTSATGILFDNEQSYIVSDFIKKSPVDMLENPIKKGDELIAVNGVSIDKNKNRYHYFTFSKTPEEIQLRFKRGKQEYDVNIHPVSYQIINTLLYDEWTAERQAIVDKASQKRVAYVHMKDMGGNSLSDFIIDMTTEAVHRDALILDLRYNRGGNVHDDVIQFLSQKPYLQWKQRTGKMSPQPNFAPSGKPIVLLINEHSLSDAEMTAAGFRELGLGKIIGTETYRWIIFTSGMSLVDGSFTRLPTWGCYDLEGNDLEITGAAPDIYVKNTFFDRINDNDPQLKKAVEEIMKELK